MSAAKFPIIGIGASAGGVPALQAFFKSMPADAGLSLVVVTHLNPDRVSLLHEVVARFTPMPIVVADDDMPVERNHVYVMPNDAVLTIKDGRLKMIPVDRARPERKPVDVFLASLAQDQGEHSAAVILSGGDGDGTLGAKAIREAGGLTLAQAPDGSAPRQPSMPQSAISSGVIDLAIPVEEMATRLVAFAKSFATLGDVSNVSDDQGGATLRGAHQDICAILTTHSGHDFSGYKTNTFFRRVRRRMQVTQLQSLADYVELLRTEPSEVNHLFRDLLINVTDFFRDEDAFRVLQQRVMPDLFKGKGAGDTIRIWVPGCATGEEVYSLAILFREHLDMVTAAPKIHIFATDIDEVALAVARTARYPEALLGGMSQERLRRFFKLDGASYVITNEIREFCIFSPHSVIKDPPFSRMDMVSCRNLLIYFGPDIQRQVIPTFHYSLKPGGYLFLGSSESIGQHTELFNVIDKKHRIYQAREHSTKMPRIPSLLGQNRSLMFPEGASFQSRENGASLRAKVEKRVLERFAPVHIVVNGEADIVYYSSGTARFLETPQGVPSRQLLTLARKGLRLDLRAALRDCVARQQPTSRHNLVVETEDARGSLVDFTIEPMKERDGVEPLYLIVFQEKGSAEDKEPSAHRTSSDDSNGELETELRDAKERLQSTIEEYETALEELKSSNEELVSVNEEAQSSNEELEASKEETQSLNEELNTINSELNAKIEELDRVNSDLRNLFESTQIATIFLDRGLVIRTFTPAAASFFNLRPSDVGRPLTDLASQLDYPNLKNDIQGVFDSGEMLDHHLAKDAKGKHYQVRLIPYRTEGHRIDGVVVTLVDVTDLAEAEQHQQVLIRELNHRVKNMLAVVGAIAKKTLANSSSIESFRTAFLGRLEAMGRAYGTLSKDKWKDASVKAIFEEELRPFGESNFTLTGPDLRLRPQIGLSLAMVAHELSTNASKYGAFSKEDGRVDVFWEGNGQTFTLDWREVGGPPCKDRGSNGFGFELIHGEIEFRLRGKLETIFHPEGLDVHIELPLESKE